MTTSKGPPKLSCNRLSCSPLALISLLFAGLALLFAMLFNLMISHRREFLADATAVKLTRNPNGLIGALGTIAQSEQMLPQAGPVLAGLFIDHPLKNDDSRGAFAALFATHPPIPERIAALKSM